MTEKIFTAEDIKNFVRPVDEKYRVEKMVVYEYDAKFRGPDGKKPKPYTYVVVSQKIDGKKKFIRMEFDSKGTFLNLLAQPLDEKDVQ